MIQDGKLGLVRAALALALCIVAAPALAERYRVDMILFLDKNPTGGEATVPAQPPNLTAALETGSTGALAAAGIEILPDTAFGLADAWQRLKSSRRYQPLIRLAWVQKDPPTERGPSLHLRWGAPMTLLRMDGTGAQTLYPVDGTVALLLGRYLHLDADLAYATTRNDGGIGVYRLKERRRMRRDELHYLDSPRLGIVTRVQKAAS